MIIPKVRHIEKLSEFPLISLCTVHYKLVTKMIVNRLKAILHELIAPHQSSFVLGRQITDNIVIVQDVIHTMHKRRSGKGLMMIKLDLEKAYDHLNWDFLRDQYWPSFILG